MKPIKAIIADDEVHLRLQLKKFLQHGWPDLQICAEAKNGVEAIDLFKKHKPQIAFLDINMPGMTGMQVAEEISDQCWIVFITSFNDYAIEAFEKAAIDYVVKPVTEERLEKTIERLKKRLEEVSQSKEELSKIIQTVVKDISKESEPEYLQWIRIKDGEEITFLPVEDVSLFEAVDKYTAVITNQSESLIRKTIKELITELNPKKFWQVSRSTIINVSCIHKISRSLTGRYVLKLKNPSKIVTISKKYVSKFKQM